jgi:hypothetical protein
VAPGRGVNFSPQEVSTLLNLIDSTLLLNVRDWGNIATALYSVFPHNQRTDEGCQHKLLSLCNQKPRTGETMPPPEVTKARQIRSKIAQCGGANSADDDDIVDQFFDELNRDDVHVEVDPDEVEATAESEMFFNPPRPDTPTFVRQASTSSDTVPASASRILQPSPIAPPFATGTTLVPQPLSSSSYEVSRQGSRSVNSQMQSSLIGMAELMIHQRQQQMEEDQQYRLQRERG